MKRVQVGEIVLIPVGNEFVPAKVLFLSKYFRNVVQLGIYRLRLGDKVMPKELPDDFADKIYTSAQCISKGRWFCVGLEALRPDQQGLSRRIAGGEVWLDDQHLGPASSSDLQRLPQMAVCGCALVEKKVASIEVQA